MKILILIYLTEDYEDTFLENSLFTKASTFFQLKNKESVNDEHGERFDNNLKAFDERYQCNWG